MPKIKGGPLKNRLLYLDDKCTPQEKEDILQKLSPEFRDKIKSGILTISWYSVDYYFELMKAMTEVLGKGNSEYAYHFGWYAAQKSFSGVYKLFFKLGSPEFIISKVPAMWKQIFDSGVAHSKITGKQQATLTITEFGELSKEFAHSMRGWIAGALALCGQKEIEAQIAHFSTQAQNELELFATWK